MRLLCLACEAFARPIYHFAADSPHLVDVKLLRIGLHNTPAVLRTNLQNEIDAADSSLYDAVIMSYGLCGRALDGLLARDIPVIVPRAHDCITLFLGSRARYQQEQETCPGTYWYTSDYIERRDNENETLALGAGIEDDLQVVYVGYVEKFGKDNADYLMEVMCAWQKHYQRAVYLNLGLSDAGAAQELAKEKAEKCGWRYEELAGDLALLRRLVNGAWDEDFLCLNPGERLAMAVDDGVIRAIKNES